MNPKDVGDAVVSASIKLMLAAFLFIIVFFGLGLLIWYIMYPVLGIR